MTTVEQRVAELKLEGLCCSQIVAKIVGLEAQGQESEALIKAMGGFRYGMYSQYTCGSLAGGIAALCLYDFDPEDCAEACEELGQWFEQTFEGITCCDLLGPGGSPTDICRESMVQTVEKCLGILEDYDLISENIFA
jgi:hypothetical protein